MFFFPTNRYKTSILSYVLNQYKIFYRNEGHMLTSDKTVVTSLVENHSDDFKCKAESIALFQQYCMTVSQ